MDIMFSKTQEFYDLMTAFEHTHRHLRLDREKRGDTPAGNWYQSGETNDVFKQYLDGYMAGRAVYLANADEAKADAALGRAVRNFREGMALFRQDPEWAFRQGYSGDIIRRDTPEAALEAAGLMEVEK